MQLKELKTASLLKCLAIQRQLVQLEPDRFTDRDIKTLHRSHQQLSKLIDRLAAALDNDKEYNEAQNRERLGLYKQEEGFRSGSE